MSRLQAGALAVGNALRYSPAASPPLVTAGTRGDRVELRVVDHGLGIPEADWERVLQTPGGGLTMVVSLAAASARLTRTAA